MARKLKRLIQIAPWLCLGALLCVSGCAPTQLRLPPADPNLPRESSKSSLSEYVIAPPDVLLIDATRLIPRPPYKIAPLDALLIQVFVVGAKDDEKLRNLRPGEPIEGIYRVEPDGTVNLGFDYGSVPLAGLTIPQAKDGIKKFLAQRFKVEFEVRVNLAEAQGMQQIRGEHLVRPDGKVTLGSYGSVYVTGMTLEQAKAAIQEHLSAKLLDPEISLDVAGYNSMVYYVIFDLDGSGQHINRLPVTGNETVLDAIGDLKGLPPGSCRMRIWVARPSAQDHDSDIVLPVNWDAITKKGSTATNYQLLPGDRVYVAVDPLIAVDGFLARVISPIERLFGIALLGNATIRNFRGGSGVNNSGIGTGF